MRQHSKQEEHLLPPPPPLCILLSMMCLLTLSPACLPLPPRPALQVPLCARRICSTRESLYMLSSHDIEEVPAYRELPASKAGLPPSDTEAMAARACEEYLSQLHKCPTLEGRMAKMKEAVGSMPLMTFQKDFFWEALDMIQRAAEFREPRAPS